MSDRDRWEQALRILEDADSGARPFGVGVPWVYFGYPTFKVDGWEFCVFDDAGEWDYIEWVTSPEGWRLEAGDETFPLWTWRPAGRLAEVYGKDWKQ